jgi:hypothetical protein
LLSPDEDGLSIADPARRIALWLTGVIALRPIRPALSRHFVDLAVTGRNEGVVAATIRNNRNIAPPGWYMLLIVDNSGVPALASRFALRSRSVVAREVGRVNSGAFRFASLRSISAAGPSVKPFSTFTRDELEIVLRVVQCNCRIICCAAMA